MNSDTDALWKITIPVIGIIQFLNTCIELKIIASHADALGMQKFSDSKFQCQNQSRVLNAITGVCKTLVNSHADPKCNYVCSQNSTLSFHVLLNLGKNCSCVLNAIFDSKFKFADS